MNRLGRATRVMLGAGALLGCVGLAFPATAADPGAAATREAGFGRGYAWNFRADNTLGTWYSLAGPYTYSTEESGPVARRDGTGQYIVRFPGIGRWGNVQVTAYGAGDVHCQAARQFVSYDPGGGAELGVSCGDRAGRLANSQFTISYNYGNPDMPSAYLYADRPSEASYLPAHTFQRGWGVATITHGPSAADVGVYTVTIPQHAGPGGHVQISARGDHRHWCKTSGWGPAGLDERVTVRCFTVGGAPVNSMFTLAFVRDAALLDQPARAAAYVWADNPIADSYTADHQWEWSTAAPARTTIQRFGVGSYAVRFPVAMDGGTVQVTAYGPDAVRCKVAGWNSSTGASISCINPDGSAADSRFTASFTSL